MGSKHAMFKFAKAAWKLIDNNEPEISDYCLIEVFKFLGVFFCFILFSFLLIYFFKIDIIPSKSMRHFDQYLDLIFVWGINTWLLLRAPYYLIIAIELIYGKPVLKEDSAYFSQRVKKRSVYVVIAVFLVLSFLIQIQIPVSKLILLSFLSLLGLGLASYVIFVWQILSLTLVLYSNYSVMLSLFISLKYIIKNFLFLLYLLIFDLFLGEVMLILREVVRRLRNPLTIFSYTGMVRGYPFLLISYGIICRNLLVECKLANEHDDVLFKNIQKNSKDKENDGVLDGLFYGQDVKKRNDDGI